MSRAALLALVLAILLALCAIAQPEDGASTDDTAAAAAETEQDAAADDAAAADVEAASPSGDSDRVRVETMTTADYQARQARRLRHDTMPKNVPDTNFDADDDDMGVNEFADEVRPAFEFGDDPTEDDSRKQKSSGGGGGDRNKQGGGGKSGGKESRKEQYERKQREYEDQKQQGSSSSSKAKAGPAQSKFPTADPDTKRLHKRAQHLRDELSHYREWLNHADRWPATTAAADGVNDGEALDEMTQLQADALASLPLPPIPGHELQHIRSAVDAAVRRQKTLAREAEKMTKDLASTTGNATKLAALADKFGTAGDVEKAATLLTALPSVADDIRAMLKRHHTLHKTLANSAMASSPVSAGLARGQLTTVEKELDRIRNEDDTGVGASERRQRRNQVKQIHKFVKSQVDDFSNARRVAQQQISAARAAFDAHALKTLAFKNAVARRAPASLSATSDYAVPVAVRVTGMTAHELAMLFLLVLVPYQLVRLTIFLGGWLQVLVSGRKKKTGAAAAAAPPSGRFPSSGGRTLGTRAAVPFFSRYWVRLAVNLVLSVLASGAVWFFLPTLSAPAFAYVTPASLWLAWAYVLSPVHQAIVAASVAWLHAMQVLVTV